MPRFNRSLSSLTMLFVSLRQRSSANANTPGHHRHIFYGVICALLACSLSISWLALFSKTAYAASPACSLSVSSATTVVSASTEQSIGLGGWPDTKLGVVKNGSTYKFIGSNGGGTVSGTSGTLDNPVSGGVITNQAIQNLHHTYNYAGGGKVYQDPANGTLLLLYHAEVWPNGDASRFYVHFGLAKSTNGGASWTDLGEILTPHVPYTTVNPQTEDMGDGSFAVVSSGGTNYLYIYFSEPGEATVATARAPLADVLNAAENQGSVVPFYKYYQGAWNEPGEGGNASNIDTTNGSIAYADVSYNTDIQRYIMIGFANYPATELDMLESSDGLTWTNRQVVFTQAGDNDVYTSIVGLGNDPSMSGSSFYLYYVDRVNGYPVERRTLSCSSSTGYNGKGSYHAQDDFSSTQGKNAWHYQYTDGTTYQDMSWDSGNSRWVGPEPYVIVGSNWQHPGNTYDSSRTWIAPQSGNVTITANGSLSLGTGGNGVNVKVMQNATQIWPASGWQTIAAGASISFPATTVNVTAGDAIHFVVSRNGGNNYFDSTAWDPIITYTAYQASTDFSGSQGQNQWYYQYTDGTIYSNMSWDSGNNRWVGPETYVIVGAGWQHPGDTYDSSRTWIAPHSGSVTITANGSLSVGTGGDGVRVKVMQNGTQLWPASGWQTIAAGGSLSFPTTTVNVAAGDAIHFVVNRNGNNYYDATGWDPVINYTSLS